MKTPIRILHILNGLGTGGAESIIMNWYRHIDREKVQFDFLIRSISNVYEDEIKEYGGRVYIMPSYPKQYCKNKKKTKHFFEEHATEYVGIHVHGNALLYVNVFEIARQNGINLRIYHSHSTSTKFQYLPLHWINRKRIRRLATDYFACSKAAGKWAFGFDDYTLVNNGINAELFAYNEKARNSVRSFLGIAENTVVVGHVGRFIEEKNHVFLIEVFEKIVQKMDAILLLIGEGDLQNKIKKISAEKSIDSRVFFLGRRTNISDYMNAMDVFLLPSLHEGLPIAAIEAQASGLPSILSELITSEVNITDLVEFLPISDSDVWAEHVSKLKLSSRRDTSVEIKCAGYDIRMGAKWLKEYYYAHIR